MAALILSACAASPAQAVSCDAQHRFTLDWSALADVDLNPGQPYTYTLTNGVGTTRTVTLSFAGDTANLGAVNGRQTPYIGSYYTGGLAAGTKTLTLGARFDTRQNDIDSATDVVVARFDFGVPVRDVSLSVFDVDYVGFDFFWHFASRDWVKVVPTNGAASYGPFLSTPYDPGGPPPSQTAPSAVVLGPYAPGGKQPLSASEAMGAAASNTTQDLGNLNVAVAQPVTRIDLRYANGPADYDGGFILAQDIAIHNVSFCPMPAIAVSKSAAPLASVGVDRFAVPAADMVYTISVTNSGGSSVDLGSLSLTDLIPANVAFYNGDFDGGTPGMGPFKFIAGTSGVGCCGGAATYASGAPARVWGYAPGAGYDPGVTGVRLAPSGTMAANSSFTIRFRVRVN